MPIDPALHQSRLERLRSAMAKADLDAVAIVPGPNQSYLLGSHFALMERPTVLFVPREDRMRMVLPVLEKPDWESLEIDAEVHAWQDDQGYQSAFSEALAALNARRIGVEGQRMRVFEMLAIAADGKAETVDAHRSISAMRLCKDAGEIEAMRRAIRLSEDALAATLARVEPGMSERAVQTILLSEFFGLGCDGLAFTPIVATGANAAMPHASSDETRIAPGDTLLFDFGVQSAGYNADITRTVFVGDPSPEARDLYETVLEANALGRAAIRAGTTAHDVDDAVQSFLEGSRFAACILHKTGHGLGLDVHEDPHLMRGNHAVLEAGQVVTVEPGLYMAGVCGVRIEDDVVVRADGGESLTQFSRALTVI